MPTAIVMPKLSDDMREGKIISWKKKPGDKVESAEVIAEVETEKANLDVECYSAGTLVQIVVPEGSSVAVGQPIAYVAEEGEDTSAPVPAAKPAPAAPVAAAKPAPAPAPAAKPAPAPAPSAPAAVASPAPAAAESHDAGARIRASPLAKKMARDGSLDLRQVQGTGPQGRVVKADVERALSAPAPQAPAKPAAPTAAKPADTKPARTPPPEMREELLPLSGMRKAIARRMAEAKPGSPHFYLTVHIDMEKALELRKQLNDQLSAEWGATLSVNDLVMRAAVLAVARFPAINASFAGDNVQRHGKIHLGFALSVDDGLLTPVIRDAQDKSMVELAREGRALAERGRARKLRPEEYTGATFTVSNLGMYGVSEFSAIINPGEAGILAVGAVEKRPVVVGDELKVGQQMTVTLSIDHRVGDGAIGAQFLRELKLILEQPLRLLA